MATITPSPTVTSHAATTMTMIAKTWPSPLPCMRLKPISARLAALSISSRQSRMTSGLRRVSTPAAPMQNTNAETTMNQLMLMSPPGHLHRLALRPLALGLQRRRADVAAGRLRHRAGPDRRQQLADADALLLVERRDAAAAAREHHRAD